MSQTTTAPTVRSLVAGQLPRRIELWLWLASAAVSAAILGLGAAAGAGFSVIGWIVFATVIQLIAVGIASGVVEGRRRAVDRIVRTLVTIAFALAIIPLISTLWTVIVNGIGQLNWTFISQATHSAYDPKTFMVETVTGSLQATVGTLIITGIATVISVPIGILTAIYLVEYSRPNQWMARTVTFLVDVMTGIPSIVAGLFAFSLFSLIVGPKAFSGFSAAIALCVLMIPTVVRSSEEMLRLVPADLREASFALGTSKFVTITRVVLPTAIAGIITGVMLAIARVIGETAPIFMAASFTDNFNANPFDGPMQTLPVMAYTGYKFPSSDIAASNAAAWGAALLLVILVVIFNLIARIASRALRPKGMR